MCSLMTSLNYQIGSVRSAPCSVYMYRYEKRHEKAENKLINTNPTTMYFRIRISEFSISQDLRQGGDMLC